MNGCLAMAAVVSLPWQVWLHGQAVMAWCPNAFRAIAGPPDPGDWKCVLSNGFIMLMILLVLSYLLVLGHDLLLAKKDADRDTDECDDDSDFCSHDRN